VEKNQRLHFGTALSHVHAIFFNRLNGRSERAATLAKFKPNVRTCSNIVSFNKDNVESAVRNFSQQKAATTIIILWHVRTFDICMFDTLIVRECMLIIVISLVCCLSHSDGGDGVLSMLER
jgi:hypothetical protein